jgi:steroid 5-alpha reductase family enzyme
MSPTETALLTAAITIAVSMVITWLASLALKNASIVDIVWGLGFVAVAWAVHLRVDAGLDSRRWLLVVMTSVWGLRLGGYLWWRNHGKGEDFRYRAMRKRWGPRFGLVSLATVFTFQGMLMWVVSLPVQVGQTDASPDLGPLAFAGIAAWATGFVFETVGDLQLARFKSDDANAGQVMDRGLWRYTRHPNYFGDACVWWGIGLVGAETGAWWTLIGPLVMTVLLVKVSGVALLERSLSRRKPGYEEYVARTSAFVPMPPKRR